jgi:NADPH:quinone reductase-like Zn-dependent oxidoreductase/acyl carrier protein
VQFGAVIAQQVQANPTLFVELSPHPILLPAMETIMAGRSRAWGSLRREQPEQALMLETLGALWAAGYPLDWSRLYPVGRVASSAPTYPWQRERYWLEVPKHAGRTVASGHPLLGEKTVLAEPRGTLLWDAEVEGLSPAAWLEMALVAGQEAFPGGSFTVEEMEVCAPFGEVCQVQLVCTPDNPGQATFRISGRGTEGSWTLHARGRLHQQSDAPAESTTSLEGLTPVHLPAHSALLEACLDGAVLTGVRMVRPYRPLPAEAWCHREGSDLRVFNAAGQLVLEMLGTRLETGAVPTRKSPDEAWFFRPAWERSDVGPLPPAPTRPGAWLVLTDGGAVGPALVQHLEARGETVVSMTAATWDPTDAKAFDALLQRPLRGVVHLWSLDTADAADLEAAALRGCGSVIRLVQALSRTGWRDMPRLWLVTRRSQRVSGPDSGLAVAQAPLWGLARTLAIEHTELQPTRIDLGGTEADLEGLLAELRAGAMEEEVAFRAEGRYVARLVRGAPPELTSGEVLEPARGRPFRVEGDTLRAFEALPPGPGEVSIAVEAAGLTGAVAESVGRVAAVGEGVDGLAVGQLVMALAVGGLASRVTVPALLVRPVPVQRSPVEAATFSVAHLTAWHALHHVAHLGAGERVLIHAGAGGVGQAALQWARHVGADIFATAGSAEERAVLHAQGVQHVSDSLQFVDDVLSWTHGEGVDVVLNSLSGVLADQSLRLLRDGGRFVELGRQGGFTDLDNRTFSRVDLASLVQKRPQQVRAWWDDIVSQGVLKPVTGKVVTFDDPDVVVAVPRSSSTQLIRSDGTYLVTGGVGGLGLELCRWLVAQGARHLLLLSRRGATGEAAQAVADLQAAGAQVVVAQADVAVRAQLAGALATMREQMPPLRGVVHAAGVLDDGMVVQLTLERLHAVMAPKVSGAWNLHELTREAPLDFFVLYSGFGALIGIPGQGNYVAANAFLDALAHLRQAQGRPGLSINWGPFSQVGLAAAQENRGNRLAGQGITSLTPAQGLGVLGQLLGTAVVQVGVALLNPRQWREYHPRTATLSTLTYLMEEATVDPSGGQAPFHEIWLHASPSEQAGLLEQFLRNETAQVLRLDPTRLDAHTPFKDLGIDSLMGLELRNRLEAGLGLTLSATLLWTHSTLAALADHLQGLMTGAPAPAEEPVESLPVLTASEQDALIDAALFEAG